MKIFQQIFPRYSEFNKNSQELTLNGLQELSKYDRVTLKDAFSHTYEPQTFEEAFGRETGWYSHYRNGFNLGYSRDITRQASISARYANELDKYSREDLSDSYLNSIGAGFNYALTSQTIFSLSYDFANRKSDPGTDAQTNTFAAGARRYLTEQLYLDGRVGLDYINSYNNTKYTKPSFLVSVTDEIDKNTRSTLAFKKQYYTNAYSEDVFNYWEISGILNRQLLERLGCSLSGFYGNGEYMASNITDKLLGANIGLTYSFNEHLKGNLNYNYSNVTSTRDTREYLRNRVSLGLNMEF